MVRDTCRNNAYYLGHVKPPDGDDDDHDNHILCLSTYTIIFVMLQYFATSVGYFRCRFVAGKKGGREGKTKRKRKRWDNRVEEKEYPFRSASPKSKNVSESFIA